MQAGRELDALVAERVLGWQWFVYPDRITRYFRQAHNFAYGAIAEGDLVEYTGNLPRYSTDIAAAWQVVEKMRANGWYCEVSEHISDPSIHYAMFASRSGYYDSYERSWDNEQEATGSTTPLAICLAALKAVGVEIEQS